MSRRCTRRSTRRRRSGSSGVGELRGQLRDHARRARRLVRGVPRRRPACRRWRTRSSQLGRRVFQSSNCGSRSPVASSGRSRSCMRSVLCRTSCWTLTIVFGTAESALTSACPRTFWSTSRMRSEPGIELEEEELASADRDRQHPIMELLPGFVHLDARTELAHTAGGAFPEPVRLFEDMSEERERHVGDEPPEPASAAAPRPRTNHPVCAGTRRSRSRSGASSASSSLMASSRRHAPIGSPSSAREHRLGDRRRTPARPLRPSSRWSSGSTSPFA